MALEPHKRDKLLLKGIRSLAVCRADTSHSTLQGSPGKLLVGKIKESNPGSTTDTLGDSGQITQLL